MKNLLLEAPILSKVTKPIFEYLYDMPEFRKVWIKDVIGYNRPEKNIKPKTKNTFSVDVARIKRETGRGFTNIDKIKNILSYKPNIDFKTGSVLTAEWLKFIGILN